VQPDPAGRVSAPAIGLLAAGGLNAALTLLWTLLLGIFGVAILGDSDAREALPGVGVWMVINVFNLALSGLMIYAGLQMRKLQSWTLCLAGAIAAMLPCAPCCILGLPMGIWALIVLIDNEVKQAFNGGGPPPGYGDPGGYAPPPSDYTPPPGGFTPPPGGSGGPPNT